MDCPKCGEQLEIGSWPFCPHGRGHNNVIGDECDITVQHGLLHADGSPMRFTSKQEMAREAKRRGLTNHVEHIGERGSDKSKHTTRWI